jgi:hypothetical protein
MNGLRVPTVFGAKQYIEGQEWSATDQNVSLSTELLVLPRHILTYPCPDSTNALVESIPRALHSSAVQ